MGQNHFPRLVKRIVAQVQLSHVVVLTLSVGLLGGMALRDRVDPIALVGVRSVFAAVATIWMNALRMTVIPLVVPLLVGALTRGTSGDQMRRTGVATIVAIFGMLSIFAAAAAFCAPLLFPADGFDAARFAMFRSGTELPTGDASFMGWLLQLVPSNPIKAAVDGTILSVVVFALSFGFAARGASSTQRALVHDASIALSAIMLRVVEGVLIMSPVGVLAIGVNMGIDLGAAAIDAFAHYLAVIAICTAGGIGFMMILAWTIGQVPPRQFVRGSGPAMLVGLSTSSSLAALPVMVDGARTHWAIPKDVTDFVLPTSVSVFKATAAFSWMIKAFFVSQLYGMPLSPLQLATAAGYAVLGNATIPGIPGGGIIAMGPLFMALGLPVEGLALLLAVDPVADRLLTMGNVTADMCVTTLVARFSHATRE